MAEPERLVILGRIAGAFGVTGWVKVQSYTDPPGNILRYAVWQLRTRNGLESVTLAEGRVADKAIHARLEGVTDRDRAAELNGTEISVLRSELPEPAPGEYYWEDLVGLQAFTPAGALLGRVDHFSETAAHPLMVLKGEREYWIPLVKGRIQKVDLAQLRMTVDWDLDW